MEMHVPQVATVPVTALCSTGPACCSCDLKVVCHDDVSLQGSSGSSQWHAVKTTFSLLALRTSLPFFLEQLISWCNDCWVTCTVHSFSQPSVHHMCRFFHRAKNGAVNLLRSLRGHV